MYCAFFTGISLVVPVRGHLHLIVLNLDRALRNIGVSRLAGNMLALLDHRELLRGVNGLDLVPGHGHIARNIAVKVTLPLTSRRACRSADRRW